MLALNSFSSLRKFALALAVLVSPSLFFDNNKDPKNALQFVDAGPVSALEVEVFIVEHTWDAVNGIFSELGATELNVAANVKDVGDNLICDGAGTKLTMQDLRNHRSILVQFPNVSFGDHAQLTERLIGSAHIGGYVNINLLKGKDIKGHYSGNFYDPKYSNGVLRLKAEIY